MPFIVTAPIASNAILSITTNQEAIIHLFKIMKRYVGNLPPMPGPQRPAVKNARVPSRTIVPSSVMRTNRQMDGQMPRTEASMSVPHMAGITDYDSPSTPCAKLN
jgi:hypothetical protein